MVLKGRLNGELCEIKSRAERRVVVGSSLEIEKAPHRSDDSLHDFFGLCPG